MVSNPTLANFEDCKADDNHKDDIKAADVKSGFVEADNSELGACKDNDDRAGDGNLAVAGLSQDNQALLNALRFVIEGRLA